MLGVRGEDATLARSLLKLPAAAGTLVAGHALDGRVTDLAARYGLGDELDVVLEGGVLEGGPAEGEGT